MGMPNNQPLVSSALKHDTRHARFTSHEKTQVVLRLLQGESAETVSRELGVSAGRIQRWKSSFVAAGSAELAKPKEDASKSRAARHSGSVWQWTSLFLAVVAIVSIVMAFLQRGAHK
jgi:hypothetical protein